MDAAAIFAYQSAVQIVSKVKEVGTGTLFSMIQNPPEEDLVCSSSFFFFLLGRRKKVSEWGQRRGISAWALGV